MHNTPLTSIEEDGLKVHGLQIGKPSQLSDAFRNGIAWALATDESRKIALSHAQLCPDCGIRRCPKSRNIFRNCTLTSTGV